MTQLRKPVRHSKDSGVSKSPVNTDLFAVIPAKKYSLRKLPNPNFKTSKVNLYKSRDGNF